MMSHVFRTSACLLFVVSILTGCLFSNEPVDIFEEGNLTPDLSISGHQYLSLLLAKKYEALSSQLAPHASSNSDGSSLEMAFALEALSRPETWLTGYFDEWVEAVPGNAVAHLARANYRMRQGIRARGTGYIGDTSDAQLSEMRRLFALSLNDLEIVKSLNHDSAYPYAVELEIAMRLGNPDALTRLYAQGLKRDPNMVWLHSSYLGALAPKWGGSEEQQKQFLEILRAQYASAPWLKSAEVTWMIANINAQPGQPCDKIDDYRRVYEFYPDSTSGYYLGKAFSCSRQFEKALPYLQASVQNWPYNARAWRIIGAIQHRLGKHEAAIVSTRRSALVDPTDDFAFFQLGEISLYLQRYDKAVNAFQQAETLSAGLFRNKQYVELAEKFVDDPMATHELVILKTSSGPLVSKTYYSDGRKEGRAIIFEDNRQKEFHFYENDVYQKMQRLNSEGNIVTQMGIRNDVGDGPFQEYSSNGNVISSGELNLGKANGEIKLFSENGRPILSNFYRNNEQVEPTKFWVPFTRHNGLRLIVIPTTGLSRIGSPLDENHQFDFDSGRPIFLYVAFDNPQVTDLNVVIQLRDASGRVSFQYQPQFPQNAGFNPGYVYYAPDINKDSPGAWTARVIVNGDKADEIQLTVN
ncbi:hypothetical protein [Marinobacter caseinilyticus]|uniref:hypothetical protein n=1 Tax=Marinobacter caseinilyticus TaxID=2692195 RepID=UPI00140C3468|nr:hypothetical protein [Marinobacter caseinilyticus]